MQTQGRQSGTELLFLGCFQLVSCKEITTQDIDF